MVYVLVGFCLVGGLFFVPDAGTWAGVGVSCGGMLCVDFVSCLFSSALKVCSSISIKGQPKWIFF
jgi:hypothetical protein